MNSLEFIEKLIKETERSIRHWEMQLENYPNEEVLTICLNKRKEELQNLFQIKTEIEAWDVVKKYTDYQDGDRFNCIPEGFYSIEPIRGKDFLIVRKALEVKDE